MPENLIIEKILKQIKKSIEQEEKIGCPLAMIPVSISEANIIYNILQDYLTKHNEN